MFYKTLILFFVLIVVAIHCQEEPDKEVQSYKSIQKELNCTENPNKWCPLNQTDSKTGCAEGYECHDIGFQNPDFKIGMCFRDKQNCMKENSPCCETTDCCRQVSDTNTASLDCVQTYKNELICKVLVL